MCCGFALFCVCGAVKSPACRARLVRGDAGEVMAKMMASQTQDAKAAGQGQPPMHHRPNPCCFINFHMSRIVLAWSGV